MKQNPFEFFKIWFDEAKKSEPEYPEAFYLATCGTKGPSVRTLLLKNFNDKEFIFFTNYNSKKGDDLFELPQTEMLFHWKSTRKQVRIKGSAQKTKAQVSDEYWKSRSYESRAYAFMSLQSLAVPEEYDYTYEFDRIKKLYPKEIPRPKHWGGYSVKPASFEFWEEGKSRWHKRTLYTYKKKEGWSTKTLFP